ncbi:TRAP transporter small permease subunit [Palleronia caenipelagi]|uniref:TRAP transporter small permease protein n=1 Tax=Palleronia caenipelagi TaxID=2489174 RepID=A0A547PL17_9RHOB|nr:TRAP transporter small permease subunit [Palleronia caenipelagi]TRD14838.1 TRAP transporter small permease subunit [Palleronia caenipelagi]
MEPRTGSPDRGTGPVHAVLRGIAWIGQAAAWLILPILVLVLISVVLSLAKVGTIFRWESDVFLFGSKLTLASLGDLQWHLFGIMLMLTIASALVSDAHVRVDFLRQHMSKRQKNIVDIIGHLLFLLPFCAVVIWHSQDFAMRSFSLGEGSDYDGLYDRYFLKSFIPIGFTLLFAAGLGLLILRLRALRGDAEEFPDD